MKPAILGLIAAGLIVLAQDAPTIRVTTRLVEVNVIVRDKGGPVGGLTKEDFTLFEKGKAREIAAFSMTSAAPSAAPPATVKMPPNIFSNRFDRSAAAPSIMTVILIDGINTDLLDQVLVRRSAIALLKTLKPGDRVALYQLGRSLRVLYDFTDDFDELRAVLARTTGEYSSQLTDSTSRVSDTGVGVLDGQFQEQNDQIMALAQIDRARRTTDALAAIARHIAVIPGRKNLIWVSGSFPIGIGNELEIRALANAMPSASRKSSPAMEGLPELPSTPGFGGAQSPQQFTGEIQKSWRALNQANVAVYPVDARGLVVQDIAIAPGTKPKFVVGPSGIDTMNLIAARTGGKAYYNTNDLTNAMREAIDDGQVTYTLGFYPKANELDGKFHELKVKTTRPGLDVRARTGYFALEEAPRTAQQIQEDLRTAATRALEITELGVSARVDLLSGTPPSLRVAVSIDMSDVRLEKKDEKWVGKLELFLFQTGPDGASLDTSTAAIPLNFTEEQYRNAAREGIVVSKTLKAIDGVRQVRVLLLDRSTGKIGSLRMPMTPIRAAAEKKAAK